MHFWTTPVVKKHPTEDDHHRCRDDTDRDDPNECGCTDERQDRAANEPPYAIKSANVFLHYLSLRVRTQPIQAPSGNKVVGTIPHNTGPCPFETDASS